MPSVSRPPDLDALADFLRALVRAPSVNYRRTAPDEPRFYSASGMADESVDLEDVATAALVYARLVRDVLG
jgi:hypothetical protein